jgi:hypothetical protein
LTPEEHVLACALKVNERFGNRAPAYVDSETDRLALARDVKGVEMWKRIAVELNDLRHPN